MPVSTIDMKMARNYQKKCQKTRATKDQETQEVVRLATDKTKERTHLKTRQTSKTLAKAAHNRRESSTIFSTYGRPR